MFCRASAGEVSVYLKGNPPRKASADVGDLPADLIRFRKRGFFVDASIGKPVHKPEADKNEDSL